MQHKSDDEVFERAYRWLERAVGFFPLFLAVGETEEDIRMTGYAAQWRRRGVPRGAPRCKALFSFCDVPNGVFMDYDNWHLVLNSDGGENAIGARERRSIFRPSWTRADWLRYAVRNPHCVQYVVPTLDLRAAARIWTPNQTTRRALVRSGFSAVRVRRIAVG